MTSFIFDPVKVRDELRSAIGIQRYKDKSIEEASLKNAVGSNADAILSEGIRCLLVGIREEGHALISKAREWLEHAIAEHERPKRYFRGGTEAIRHNLLAMCNWILDARHDLVNLREAVRWYDIWFQENYRDKEEVELTLSIYIDAQEFEKALALFESTPDLNPPNQISQVDSEGVMAYLLCKHHCESSNNASQLESAFARFFKRSIPQWLGRGHYKRAAQWMKIRKWSPNPDEMTPEVAVLKCYDFLPNLEPPPTT